MLKAAATKSPIVPCLTYRDAPAAIEFLCKAFGFEKKLVVPGENGTIALQSLSAARDDHGRIAEGLRIRPA